MAVSPGLLTIGEFAKRCRLTIVTLRHYDHEGLVRRDRRVRASRSSREIGSQ